MAISNEFGLSATKTCGSNDMVLKSKPKQLLKIVKAKKEKSSREVEILCETKKCANINEFYFISSRFRTMPDLCLNR